ncbi:hypothetical protein [Photobacterium kishitanii]|uniref:hypothetical protein n=1 Tax=Photobacterium kishitanii TaxID=318456 RepID=UPI0011B279E6|nr:hypothetical protein [Photobacterium kishitanii]
MNNLKEPPTPFQTNLTDSVIGDLHVREAYQVDSTTYHTCQCSCGHYCVIPYDYLNDESTTMCTSCMGSSRYHSSVLRNYRKYHLEDFRVLPLKVQDVLKKNTEMGVSSSVLDKEIHERIDKELRKINQIEKCYSPYTGCGLNISLL